MTNDKDPIQLAIDALDAALDSHGVNASKYIRASLKQLRALQSQPATDGMGKVREALEFAAATFRDYENIHLSKSPPDRAKAERNGDYALKIEEALAILDQQPASAHGVVGLDDAIARLEERHIKPTHPDLAIVLKAARLYAQSAQAVPDVWQPIESAPRDGTEIILYKSPNKQCNSPFWVIGKYVGREELMPYGQCYKVDNFSGECGEQEEFKIKVLVTSWNHKDISSTGFTHWMPLPAAPKHDLSKGE